MRPKDREAATGARAIRAWAGSGRRPLFVKADDRNVERVGRILERSAKANG